MADHKLAVPEGYIRAGEYNKPELCAKITKELLSMAQPPTCILMPDDYTAVNTIRILHEEGLNTPEQFSCAGYDGIPLSQAVSPRVTTFSQDTETIGRKAVEILIQAMQEGPGLKREITVRGKLIPGETVAAVG